LNTEDIPSSFVVGTYLGGSPGETMLDTESRSDEPQTMEQLVEQNGAWAGYVSDENLCCGPEKSF
jgi:heterodisulfide reductase subunit B